MTVSLGRIQPRTILPLYQFHLRIWLETVCLTSSRVNSAYAIPGLITQVSLGSSPDRQYIGATNIKANNRAPPDPIDLTPLPAFNSKRFALGKDRRQRPAKRPLSELVVLRGESANLLIEISNIEPLGQDHVVQFQGRLEIVARDGSFTPDTAKKPLEVSLYPQSNSVDGQRRRPARGPGNSSAVASITLDFSYVFKASSFVMPFALAAGSSSLTSAVWERRLLEPVEKASTDYRVEYSVGSGQSWVVKQKGWLCPICRVFGRFPTREMLQFHMKTLHGSDADTQWVEDDEVRFTPGDTSLTVRDS